MIGDLFAVNRDMKNHDSTTKTSRIVIFLFVRNGPYMSGLGIRLAFPHMGYGVVRSFSDFVKICKAPQGLSYQIVVTNRKSI